MSASISSSSTKSDRSQLVDLVIEDHEAGEIERVRARKEGGPASNEVPPKYFVFVNTALTAEAELTTTRRTYPDDHQAEEVRERHEPQKHDPFQPSHNTDGPFTIGDNNEVVAGEALGGNSEEAEHWEQREHTDTEDVDEQSDRKPVYGSFPEERHIWGK